MQRFFLPDLAPNVDEEVSLAPIHHQLRRVLRVQPGTQVVVLDNQGSERLMEIVAVERRETTARVVEVRPAPPEPAVALTLYQSVLKADKFELILQKATELGVTTVVPVISARTVARPGRALQAKQARWESIVREAAEQSGRGAIPVVAPAVTFDEAVASGAGVRLLPWEEALEDRGLLAALGQVKDTLDAVCILIGPEGGLESGEVEVAIAAGWQVISLGKRILRAETAALASLSIVSSALGALGDAPTVKVPTPPQVREKKAAIQKRSEKKDEEISDPEPTADSLAASSVVTPTAGEV